MIPTIYLAAYIGCWAVACVATLLRPRVALAMMWPLVMLHPHPLVRDLLPWQRMGLQNWYLLLCLFRTVWAWRPFREGIRDATPTLRWTLRLLVLLAVLHLYGLLVLWYRHPWLPGLGWAKVAEQVFSDLRYLAPPVILLSWVRTRRDQVLAIRSLSLSLFLAASLVALDRFSPLIFDLFNHTAYESTWEMHQVRAVGAYSGPWEVGGIGSLGIVWATTAVVNRRALGRLSGLLLLTLSVVSVVFALSRAGFVASAIGLVGVLLFARQGSKVGVAGLLITAAVVLAMLQVRVPQGDAPVTIPGLIEEGVEKAYEEGALKGSAAIRVRLWQDQIRYYQDGLLRWDELVFGMGGIEGMAVAFEATGHNGYIAPFLYYGIPAATALHLFLLLAVLASLRDPDVARRPEGFVMWGTILGGMITSEFLISGLTTSVLASMFALTGPVPGDGPPGPVPGGPSRGPGASPSGGVGPLPGPPR